MDLTKQVLQNIYKNKLTSPGDTVVVGVSGGADSVALLHVLYQLRHPLAIKLHVAHLNHRLRPTAERDETFVRNLTARLNLPITVLRRKEVLKSHLVSEDKARQWRFDFFQKVAKKNKAEAVALAHTQNDLAETVLMRILRGSGLQGVRGILMENTIEETRFIRPFLSIQRKQIEQYLQEHHLKYCVDETNQQTHYLRNKIRLKLLPSLIKEYNTNLPNVLVDLARTTQADYDYILKNARKVFQRIAKISKFKIEIKLKPFLKEHICMQRMILRLSFEHLVGDVNQLSLVHMKEAEDMLSARPEGSMVHWPQSVGIVKLEGTLVLRIGNTG